MSKSRFSPRVIVGIVILVFFGVAVIIRLLPWDQVFGGQTVAYTSVDCYYYMRMVDNMVYNFPQYTSFDPFHIYPGGQVIEHLGFFYQLLAGFVWLFGLGHPSQHLVDVFGVLFPVILAGLVIIPVYFIGKTLFNKWVGVIAAALMAVFPGEYLGRSFLGFSDTPIIETFLTATSMAFLILAVKTASERQLAVGHLLKLERGVFLRPVIYSLLAGFFLGLYMVTWNGALLFVFIITLYLVVQFIIDHLAGRSTEYLGIVGFLVFLVNGIMYLPVSLVRYIVAGAVIAIFIPVVMAAVSRYMAGRGLRPVYYPLGVLGLAVVLVGIMFAVSSHTLGNMISAFSIFTPVGSTAVTTMEMQPFLSPTGGFSTGVAWGNFTTSFFLFPDWAIPGFAFISLAILIYLYTSRRDTGRGYLYHIVWVVGILILLVALVLLMTDRNVRYLALLPLLVIIGLFFRRRSDNKILLLFFVWTLIIIMATMAQRRFAYYLVVNMALLSAWLSWEVVWRFCLRKLAEPPKKAPEEVKSKKHRRRRETGPSIGGYRVITGLVAAAVFAVIFIPNIVKAEEEASAPAFLPSVAWQESLSWMKDNTPEPLGSPDDYYRLYEKDFVYPDSAYGVTSWWDYGYWITRIGHRIPSANPSQDPDPIMNVSNLFLSRDAATTENMTDALGTRYIVGDHATATSKFWAIATWAGEPEEVFRPEYYVQQDNRLVRAQVYSPEYYRTLYIRLYSFDGKAVTEVKPIVITSEDRTTRDGFSYRLITGTRQFNNYQDALDYVQEEGPDTHAVVGNNPFVSPVPLEAVPDFKLIFKSTRNINTPGAGSRPEVKIFEYTRP